MEFLAQAPPAVMPELERHRRPRKRYGSEPRIWGQRRNAGGHADPTPTMHRACDAGVWLFVRMGGALDTSGAAGALAHKELFFTATVGVPPNELKHIEDNWYDELRALAKSKGVVAYGEIGLDYRYALSP